MKRVLFCDYEMRNKRILLLNKMLKSDIFWKVASFILDWNSKVVILIKSREILSLLNIYQIRFWEVDDGFKSLLQ